MCEFECLFKEISFNVLSKKNDQTYFGYTHIPETNLITILKQNGYSFAIRTSTAKDCNHYRFQYVSGDWLIECDNFPFLKLKRTSYNCVMGKQYCSKKKDTKNFDVIKKTRNSLQPSKKRNCEAFLKVCHVRFPTDEKYKLKPSKNWRYKQQILTQLKSDLDNGVPVKFANRLYFQISMVHNHDISAIFSKQTIDYRVSNHIRLLVSKGCYNAKMIKEKLREFVIENFPNAPSTSRAFFPEIRTIYNCMLKFSSLIKKTKVDQDALQKKIADWTSQDTCRKIYFRPFSDTEDNSDTFLFCFQERWQQDFLCIHGGITILHATYKRIRYNLPLYMIAVKVNNSYMPVGVFILENANSSSIEEALKIFQQWNPHWEPQYFVTDLNQAEFTAVRACFSSKIYICVAHREQAWKSWLKRNGGTNKRQIRAIWRKIASCTDHADFVNLIQSAERICDDNEKALSYFQTSWLPHIEKWSLAFNDPETCATIHPNMRKENVNYIFKQYLKKYSQKSVAVLMSVIIDHLFYDRYNNLSYQESTLPCVSPDKINDVDEQIQPDISNSSYPLIPLDEVENFVIHEDVYISDDDLPSEAFSSPQPTPPQRENLQVYKPDHASELINELQDLLNVAFSIPACLASEDQLVRYVQHVKGIKEELHTLIQKNKENDLPSTVGRKRSLQELPNKSKRLRISLNY